MWQEYTLQGTASGFWLLASNSYQTRAANLRIATSRVERPAKEAGVGHTRFLSATGYISEEEMERMAYDGANPVE